MVLDVTTVALVCLGLLAAGYAVVLALTLLPARAATAREVLGILHTEAVIVVTAVAAVWIGGWVLALCLIALALRVSFEACAVVLKPAGAGQGQIRIASLTMAALVCLSAALPLHILILPALAALAIAWARVALGRPAPHTPAGAALALAAFPAIPLALFVAAGFQGLGAWLLAAFFLVETFDSYALLGGRLFGRTKAFPALSPRKTVEGLAAGAGMLMLTAALVGALLFGAPVAAAAGFALAVGALAVAGDLAASRLKRLGGVKDYPAVIAVQGGVLDIADAWIAAGAGVAVLAVLAGLA